jgi:hypothetical protein
MRGMGQMQLQLQLISQVQGDNPPGIGVQKPVRILIVDGAIVPIERVILNQPVRQPGQQFVKLQPPGQQPAIQQQLVQLFAQLQPPGQQLAGLLPQQQAAIQQLVQQLLAMIQRNPQLLALLQKNPPLLGLFLQYQDLAGTLQQEMLLQQDIEQPFGQPQLKAFLDRYKNLNPGFDYSSVFPATSPGQSSPGGNQKIGP